MATGFAVLSASPVLALNYQFGEVSVSLDSTISLGAGVRASKQDCRHIGGINGGCPAEQGWDFGPANDDGNINFDQWDFYSAAAKVTSDLEMRWRNYGAFARATAFYDYIGYERAGKNSTPYGNRPLVDDYRGNKARNAAGRDLELLDAFVFGNFDVAGQPLTVRLGQQVVNWGESLFIRGGINSYLPINVAATRTPGAEVKEALMPLPGGYFNLGLPASFNLEAFAFADWKESKLDPAGTFFSTNDFFGPGGVYTAVDLDDPELFPFFPGAWIPREQSWEPDNEWQYGAKLGHYAGWLNGGTDLGLYFVNYHSSLPILTFAVPARSSYLAQFPEDIRQFGASFNTTVDLFGGTALAGEISYSPNMPLQINTDDINTITAAPLVPIPGFAGLARAATLEADGRTVRGYVREKVITGQLQTTSTFSTSQPVTRAIGADNTVLLANAGFQYLPDVDDATISVLNSPGASSSHPDATVHSVLNPGNRQANIHADSVSWGYRLVALADYNNAFGTPFTITPSVQFGHDVKGKSAGPIGPGFVENTKTVTLGVSARYQSTWQAQIQYTNFFGNSEYNVMSDKDFITASISYAF